MSHAAYVALAYGMSFIVIAGLVVRIVLDQKARMAELAALEKAGVRRRSDRADSTANG